jgi:ArsR family transcriptional regulator
MVRLMKAVSDPNRLRIITILGRGPLNVTEVSSVLHLEQSNVSRHLRILLEAGILRKEGRSGWVYYGLDRTDPLVSSLLDLVDRGKRELPSLRADMTELARCYRERVESSRRFFDRMADRWQDVKGLLPDPEGYVEALLGMLGTPERVLDVGCGGGDMMGRLAGIAGKVIGVDNSDGMLSAARDLIAGLGLGDRADVRLGEAEHLPLGDRSVDAVLVHMVLHHAGEPSEVLREAGRVLTDGGSCVVVELRRHDMQDMRLVHGDLWPGFEPAELTEMARAAGLESVDSLDIENGKAAALLFRREEHL